MSKAHARIAIAALLAVAGCGGSPISSTVSPETRGVVLGRVVSSPTCPVQTEGQKCPPRPVSGALVVATRGGERQQTHTDETGRFRMMLPPGHYTVEATNVGGFPSTDSTDLDIGRSPVEITLNVDSGIR